MAKEATDLKEATEYFSKANDDWQNARIVFFEKIALYSGAIISLSITFIGYILSKDVSIISYLGYYQIPLYAFIFNSWACLVISLVLGIFIRLFSARHASLTMGLQWIKFYRKNRQDIYNEIASGQAVWKDVTDVQKSAKLLKEAEDTLEKYATFEKRSGRWKSQYDFMRPVILTTTVTLFIFGIVLALLFVSGSIFALA